MWLSEAILYFAAKRMYRTGLAQSEEMSDALSSDETYHQYRKECLNKVIAAATQYGVDVRDQVVLDLGCSDGALTPFYASAGAKHVIGVDIDKEAVDNATKKYSSANVEFCVSDTKTIPLPGAFVDRIMCYDVFEHVSDPLSVLSECYRVLRPGGQMLIGTWGWHHPFAPHLWSTMPVPWAHVLFSEKTLLRTCRKVYNSSWYVPNMHDFDRDGKRIPDKYTHEAISPDYLNKFLVSDFERVFAESNFKATVNIQPFSSKWAAWTKPLLKLPIIREFFTAYIWVVLERPLENDLPRVTLRTEGKRPVMSAVNIATAKPA